MKNENQIKIKLQTQKNNDEEKMNVQANVEMEHKIHDIARKIGITPEYTAELILKESLGVKLRGIEEALLDMKNGNVEKVSWKDFKTELEELRHA